MTSISNKTQSISLALLVFFSMPSSARADPLTGSEWGPKNEAKLFVQFRVGGKIAGNGGCNRFMGSYIVDGTALTFGPIASTKKLCPPEIMKAEMTFLAALSATSSFTRQHHRLELRNKTGAELLTLRHRDWD